VSSNITAFLEDLKQVDNPDKEKIELLKKTLLLEFDIKAYIDLFKRFGVLDSITADIILKKSTEEQVKTILSMSLPIKESAYPAIAFGVLKNYRGLIKELYQFLVKISDSGLKSIINDALFDSNYFIYLCRLMKNDVRFFSLVVQLKKYDKNVLSIFAESSEPEVLFRVGNIRHIVENDDELIKKILFNPFSPDETITLMKQIMIDKAETLKSLQEKVGNEGENETVTEEVHDLVPIDKNIDVKESYIEKKVNENIYNKINKMNMAEKIKLALKGNKTARMLLIRDPNKQVSLNVLKNPKITEQEIEFILKNKATGEHIIREVARTSAFIKDYNILREIVFHPKTPLNISMTFMNRLFVTDLEKLSKSRDVPANLKNQAIRLLKVKTGNK